MQISEIFGPTIQGEIDVGKRVTFIRLSGCNLIRNKIPCKFCDTLYAEQGKEMEIGEILKEVKKRGCQNIIISGGEPTYQSEELKLLMDELNHKGFIVGIETNGTLYREDIFRYCNTISCSPKKQKINLTALRNLAFEGARFKFVYDDSKWWENIIKKANLLESSVYIMPEGKTKEKQEKSMKSVVEYCIKNGYNFTPRLHVLIYDAKRGV